MLVKHRLFVIIVDYIILATPNSVKLSSDCNLELSHYFLDQIQAEFRFCFTQENVQ